MEDNAFLAATEELAQQAQDDSLISSKKRKHCKNVREGIKAEINKKYKLKHESSKTKFVPKNNTMEGMLKSYEHNLEGAYKNS